MTRVEGVHAAIQHIYEAVLSPDEWEGALARMTAAVGANRGMLVATQLGAPTLSVSTGIDPTHALSLQSEFQSRLPEWIKAIPVGVPRRQSSEISDADFKRTYIYCEVVKPEKAFYGMILPVACSRERTIHVSAGRSLGAPDFCEDDLSAAAMIAPHLTAALNVRYYIPAAELRANGAFELLSRLNFGVILLDSKARPIFVNPFAESLCQSRDGLLINHREVSAFVPADAQKLREAILLAIAFDADGTPATVDQRTTDCARSCRVSRRLGRLPLVLRALPVKAFDSSSGVGSSVAAMLLIFDYERPVAIDRSLVAKTFGLTRREAEFATLLARGLDLAQAALEMRIKPSTAREYLKDIHGKTQTH